MEVIHIDLIWPKRREFEKIRNALREGKVLLYPCDTCWALTTKLSSQEGVEKIYKIKDRPRDMAVSLAFADRGQAARYVDTSEETQRFMKKYMPERLTMLMPIKKNMFPSYFTTPADKVGVRIPKDTFTRKLAQAINEPIITTSANIHGKPEFYTWHEVENFLQETSIQPDIIIFRKNHPKNPTSTIVDTGVNPWKIIRQGAFQLPRK